MIADLIDRRPDDLPWTPGQRIDLANLYEACHRLEAALEIYRSVPGGGTG